MAQPPRYRSSLAEAGQQTMALFKRTGAMTVPATIAEPSGVPKKLFAAQGERFELWSVNMGLFVSGHGSLDYRLREAASLGDTFLKFITDLNRSLEEVLGYYGPGNAKLDNPATSALADSDPDTSEDDVEEDTDEAESDLDLLLKSVQDPIDRLYKLATKIRNTASRSGYTKALRYEQIDEETGINLFQACERFDYDYVSSVFLQYEKTKTLREPPPYVPTSTDEVRYDGDNDVREPNLSVSEEKRRPLSTDRQSFLIRRIARANGRRRQQFAYWRKHRDKLATQTERSLHLDSTGVAVNQGETDLDRGGREVAASPRGRPEQSVTTATRLVLPQREAETMDDRSIISVSEYTPSAWRPGKEVVDFPPPPNEPIESKFFECPYCFTLCSTALLKVKAWKAHLIHDLRPYMCTYEDCKNPDELYDAKQEWIQHENHYHRRVWRCPEHSNQVFFSLLEYRDHLQEAHGKESATMTASTASYGEMTFDRPDRICPICSINLESMQQHLDHIALHLERLAIFAFPRGVEHDEEDTDNANSSQANCATEGSRENDSDSEQRDFDSISQNSNHASDGSAAESHWAQKIFDGRHSSTPLRSLGEPTRCLGRDEPEAVDMLDSDGFIKVVDMPFEATDVWVRLYWRFADQRARILFLTLDDLGRRKRYCIPLTALKILRVGSCLQFCRENRSDSRLDLWANLRFTLHERMVLFYCTCAAMKYQDNVPTPDRLEDWFPGEIEEYSGEVQDGNYLHMLRIFRDEDSRCVRFETTARRGPKKAVPIWTAFVTEFIADIYWMRRLGPNSLQFSKLHPYVFRDGYKPPRGPTGKYELTFTSPEDSQHFFDVFHHIQTINTAVPQPSSYVTGELADTTASAHGETKERPSSPDTISANDGGVGAAVLEQGGITTEDSKDDSTDEFSVDDDSENIEMRKKPIGISEEQMNRIRQWYDAFRNNDMFAEEYEGRLHGLAQQINVPPDELTHWIDMNLQDKSEQIKVSHENTSQQRDMPSKEEATGPSTSKPQINIPDATETDGQSSSSPAPDSRSMGVLRHAGLTLPPDSTKILRKRKGERGSRSIGTEIGPLGKGQTCWEAVGPAKALFKQLDPSIKEYFETAGPRMLTGHVVYTLYMIGKSRETASPVILFVSEDRAARKELRKALEESKILEEYASIRLGDCARAPEMSSIV